MSASQLTFTFLSQRQIQTHTLVAMFSCHQDRNDARGVELVARDPPRTPPVTVMPAPGSIPNTGIVVGPQR